MYAATGGPNLKWEGTDFKWGAGHHCPPRWRRSWMKYFSAFRTFEQLVDCPEKQSVPWIHCIENIYIYPFRILNNLRMPWKIEFALKFFAALKYFYLSGFFRNLRLPWKRILSWNFSLYLIYFLHSGCLNNFCLPWKTECVLNSLYSMYFLSFIILKTCACPELQSLPWKCSLHWNNDFWGTCACSENRFFPEIFHCIEYSFYIQDFWATCACHEQESVHWIHYIFHLPRFLSNLTLPWKQSWPWIFQAGEGDRPPRPPASYATDPKENRRNKWILSKNPNVDLCMDRVTHITHNWMKQMSFVVECKIFYFKKLSSNICRYLCNFDCRDIFVPVVSAVSVLLGQIDAISG